MVINTGAQMTYTWTPYHPRSLQSRCLTAGKARGAAYILTVPMVSGQAKYNLFCFVEIELLPKVSRSIEGPRCPSHGTWLEVSTHPFHQSSKELLGSTFR
jgi:hypothetical protein